MGDNNDDEQCFLVLEDGSVFAGTVFGAKKPIDGEVGKFTRKVLFSRIRSTRGR